MNLCGTCQHWGNDKDKEEIFRECQAVIHDAECLTDQYADRRWLNDEQQAEKTAMRARKAIVQDGSGYEAALRCREDFGCVLWKEREP